MQRREFVAGATTAALLTTIPAWAAEVKQFQLGVITDEVTQDFEKALLWAKSYGLPWVELRFVWNKYVTEFSAVGTAVVAISKDHKSPVPSLVLSVND